MNQQKQRNTTIVLIRTLKRSSYIKKNKKTNKRAFTDLMLHLSSAAFKPENQVIKNGWSLSSLFSGVEIRWLSVTDSLPLQCSVDCWAVEGGEQMVQALSSMLRDSDNCGSRHLNGSRIKVGISEWWQPTLDLTLLSAEWGSQECRAKCTCVTHRRIRAKRALTQLLLISHPREVCRCKIEWVTTSSNRKC